MTEPRCIHCRHWEMDGTAPVRNRLAEERALQVAFGPNIGLAGACEHPDYTRIGATSLKTCGLWEEHPEMAATEPG